MTTRLNHRTFLKAAGAAAGLAAVGRTGRAAWLDWPWKLHRIQKKGAPKFELYNLARDPYEKNDRTARQADRVKAMRADLELWLTSVVRSLNGEDYR